MRVDGRHTARPGQPRKEIFFGRLFRLLAGRRERHGGARYEVQKKRRRRLAKASALGKIGRHEKVQLRIDNGQRTASATPAANKRSRPPAKRTGRTLNSTLASRETTAQCRCWRGKRRCGIASDARHEIAKQRSPTTKLHARKQFTTLARRLCTSSRQRHSWTRLHPSLRPTDPPKRPGPSLYCFTFSTTR